MSTPLMILGAFFVLGAGFSFYGTWTFGDHLQYGGAKSVPSGAMAFLTLSLAYLAFRSFGGTL